MGYLLINLFKILIQNSSQVEKLFLRALQE